MLQAFDVDLISRVPTVKIIDSEVLKEGLKLFNIRDPEKLSTNDRKVFNYEIKADRYLEKYQDALKSLKLMNEYVKDAYPHLISKRRYLVQTSMGEKLSTIRTYKKNWKKGQLFNLYDQTYYVAVKLKSIRETSDGKFKYSFELVE